METAGKIQRRIHVGGTVDCRICGTQTQMLGTQLCDSCWEVTSRLKVFLRTEAGMEMAKAIIKSIEDKEGEKK